MKLLNRGASEAALAAGAHAMTDITGFGFLGHAREMAVAQEGVDFRFNLARLPWLPGALRYVEAGSFPGGMGNNLSYFAPYVNFSELVSTLMQVMLWTPDTSGGLLVALSPDAVTPFLAGCPAWHVGEVIPGEGRIQITD